MLEDVDITRLFSDTVYAPLFFPGYSLTQFMRHCADNFLNSEHKEIRGEAVRTCSHLLTPSLKVSINPLPARDTYSQIVLI